MTSTTAGPEVLKQDRRGRVRVTRERREALLAEFDRSNLSGAKFAELAGIKYSTFANWVRQRRKQRAAAVEEEVTDEPTVRPTGPVRLFEAMVDGRSETILPTGVEGLLVELPGGSRVRVRSPLQLQWAAELVGLVAQRERARC
jgi:hypothetical protein